MTAAGGYKYWEGDQRSSPPTLGRAFDGLYGVHGPLGLIGGAAPWTERQSERKQRLRPTLNRYLRVFIFA